MRVIDLNVDIGEGLPYDRELLKLASSANVCCGAHAGSPELTRETVALCIKMGVRVGAHPGYPDRENFGRVIPANPEAPEIMASLKTQIESIPEADYVKPHGAWYNRLAVHSEGPDAEMLRNLGLPVMMLAGFPLADIAEGFIDRGYDENGRLIPRGKPGALIESPEEAVEQALRLAERCDSLCLHGDGAHCLELLERVRVSLEAFGFVIGPK